MRLLSFSLEERRAYGVLLDDDLILDLPRAADLPPTLAGFISAGEPALDLARSLAVGMPSQALVPYGEVRVMAPIPRPAKNVFCVGLNYKDHIAEGVFGSDAGSSMPAFPEFFTKAPTTVVGHLDVVPRHADLTDQLDYEGELAVVIGRRGTDIPAAAALKHVFGYTILNDVTARDLQHSHKQWFRGKSLDGTCPMGPAIVTVDEISDPSRLRLTTEVNGEPRQDASLSEMIFDVPRVIAALSAGLTLEPGDIVATGTPKGVGYARKPPRLLQTGDEVVVAITGIGELRNRIG